MKIGINTLAVNREDFGGGERYLYFLLKYLAKIDQDNEYFIFVSSKNKDKFSIVQKNFKTLILPVNTNSRIKRILYEQFFLPGLLKKYRIDVFHGTNNTLPLRIPCKTVVTSQYMFSFLMPKDYTPAYRRWYFNNLMKNSLRKANKIISVSHDNKHQIIRYLKIPEYKISVIYHGLDESFTDGIDLKNIESFKSKYGIINNYILCVANNVLNKNFEGLIEAFNYLKQKYNITYHLVIAGNTGFLRKRQIWFQKMKNKYPDIIHTGYIDWKQLSNLYSGASVFVLSSYCESFGLPILEAMACGCPVVTSNIFAMPEIVGNAGLKVDPYNFKEIGDAIYTILNNNLLREELIKRGLKRVKMFSWEKAAKETLEVYKEVYKQ